MLFDSFFGNDRREVCCVSCSAAEVACCVERGLNQVRDMGLL